VIRQVGYYAILPTLGLAVLSAALIAGHGTGGRVGALIAACVIAAEGLFLVADLRGTASHATRRIRAIASTSSPLARITTRELRGAGLFFVVLALILGAGAAARL
jgi:hypothetical protein